VRRRRPPLSQHFLTDPAILRRIVDALEPGPQDLVVEVGAGKGTLTSALCARVGRVIAIETDRRLSADFGQRLAGCTNVQWVQGDALREDWSVHSPRFKLCGNIPYAITSPLIDRALTPPVPDRIVFLVQREVADRLAAKPGTRTYGALSVGVQAAARVERLFTVKAGSFSPPPRVQSAVVRLTPLEHPLVPWERVREFRTFVVACFGQRRKQLRNALATAWGVSASIAADRLFQLGIDPASRGETLSPSEFVRLFLGSTPPLDASA
jgi:16S rRNA (adenine1518-N6/adenine1519-N6)-dimethyltransferase